MVWLLDCQFMHKGRDLLDWMKETNKNILVIFIPTNYIDVLQPTNVILQWSLKHAFKTQFNSWTTAIIKQQIENNKNP
jgi:hypothetical protein